MPYSGPSDKNLPKNVKSMPPSKRKRWVAIFNNVMKECQAKGGKFSDCETKAFAIANGTLKKSK